MVQDRATGFKVTHSLTTKISETVRDTDLVSMVQIGTYTRPTQQCQFEWP